MPDLKENTTYKSLRGAIAPMIKTSQEIGRSLPQPRRNKRVDVSMYKDLMNQLDKLKIAQSTPSTATVGNEGVVTTPYLGSTKFESQHGGIDIANKENTPIPAFVGGTVSEVNTNPTASPYGEYTIITDAQGNKHRYSHLANVWVSVGENVGKGTILGGMGHTGNVYSQSGGLGTHLDYRVKNLYNQYINPATYISS